MLKLPGTTPLPSVLSDLLTTPDCRKLLETPEGAVSCPSLASLDGITLALALQQEHTAAGRHLVHGIWFDQPVTLWLCQGTATLRLTADVYRCHIVGTLFSQMLQRARAETPRADIAVAWELMLRSWAQTSAQPPADAPVEYTGEDERHL